MENSREPIIAFDIRAQLLAGLILIIAIVASKPLSLVEFLVTLALLCALGLIYETNFARAFKTGLLVIPFAGFIALTSPLARLDSHGIAYAYQTGWPLIIAILTKAFFSAFIVSIVVNSTDITHLIAGLNALKMPAIFITLFTFLYRFNFLFREQLAQMQRALKSRAPHLRGIKLLITYGKLGGNTFVRAYERGEEVYNAMISRGYNGSLTSSRMIAWKAPDTLLILFTCLYALALTLY